MYYYVVKNGIIPGIYDNWSDCQKQVSGFKNAKFKKFKNHDDAVYFYKYGNRENPQTMVVNGNALFRTQMKLDKFIVYGGDGDNHKDSSSSKKTKSHVIFGTTTKIDMGINEEDIIIVYTDGCCINNGKRNAKAGYGIYFGPNDTRNVSKRIVGKQTNNVAEITAIIEAIISLKQEIDKNIIIHIYTDSEYSIKCCYKYGEKLEKNNWVSKYPIPNLHLVKKAYYLCKLHKNIKIHYVKAHTGNQDPNSIGNFHADRLANEAIKY